MLIARQNVFTQIHSHGDMCGVLAPLRKKEPSLSISKIYIGCIRYTWQKILHGD